MGQHLTNESFVAFFSVCVGVTVVGVPEPLGMADGRIHDDQIEASSSKDENHDHVQARLESNRYWKPNGNEDSWIQVTFTTVYTIRGIQTQRGDHNKWVKKFKVRYATNTAGSNQFIMNAAGDEKQVRHFRQKCFE